MRRNMRNAFGTHSGTRTKPMISIMEHVERLFVPACAVRTRTAWKSCVHEFTCSDAFHCLRTSRLLLNACAVKTRSDT